MFYFWLNNLWGKHILRILLKTKIQQVSIVSAVVWEFFLNQEKFIGGFFFYLYCGVCERKKRSSVKTN